jgi:hypothetical protein
VDHLWDFILYSPDHKKPFDPLHDDFDDDDDEEEKEPTGIRIAREMDNDFNDDCYRYNVRNIPPRTMLSENVVPLGHVGTFKYDYSNTTKVYLKVLSVRAVQGDNVNNNKDAMFGYFVEAGDQTSNERGGTFSACQRFICPKMSNWTPFIPTLPEPAWARARRCTRTRAARTGRRVSSPWVCPPRFVPSTTLRFAQLIRPIRVTCSFAQMSWT